MHDTTQCHNPEDQHLNSPNIIRMIKIKEIEMDKTCSIHGIPEKCTENFSLKI
jgi:hypothetical protein